MYLALFNFWLRRFSCVFSPLALPDARHVHLVPVEDIKVVIIKHVGSAAQNIWELLLHWPGWAKKNKNIPFTLMLSASFTTKI